MISYEAQWGGELADLNDRRAAHGYAHVETTRFNVEIWWKYKMFICVDIIFRLV
jgi:hypothetical protein